ncbi:hypothetical protein CCACVL1_28073 [Corchorus capsularis]|uniref:F-box domain-containing protein n=1 Tax=Corchorus capsularis TaxID=210143 RepID=A0A1R3G7M8_COCAP|nr:hypothetical protein CCACVL1_28073 [Corchorus capsularis]
MDRISNLPPHIIHQIMSHLSTKQVAQTTLLSKQWKDYLRPSFPILVFSHFDFIDFKEEEQEDCLHYLHQRLFKLYRHKFEGSVKGFTELVDATLDRFCKMKLRMYEFKLIIGTTGNSESWSCLVDKWIGLALEHQVKDLTLQIFHKQLYLLPETAFSTKSITNLRLYNCKLNHPSATNAFKFHSLQKLELVRVDLDELMIQRLTRDSPLLEVIELKHCQGFENCHVPELLRLRKFSMTTDELISIQIEAPNLHYFYLLCFELQRPLSGINNSPNLRFLSLCGNLIADDHTFQDLISKFPLLEYLAVMICDTLRKVTISSKSLKKLKFSECNELEAVHIDTPNLLEFYFNCTQVPIVSINAPCPWEICFRTWGEVDIHWYLKLKKFLGTSNHIQKLSIPYFETMHSFNFQEFRQGSSSRPLEIQDLRFLITTEDAEGAAMLDGYFSRIYETLEARRDVDCCSDSSVKCWRHYLKDVKFLSFEGGFIDFDKAWPNLPEGVVHFALEWEEA